MGRYDEISPDALALEGELRLVGLEPRDEAALLLTVAAEIEHALMVQYLYAAYSIRHEEESSNRPAARQIHLGILQIGREEMGHLMTVQNLLHLIGAPLNLERSGSPFESQLYPFRFKLERVSLHSLAKYVTAERPAKRPADFPPNDWEKLEQIQSIAKRANDGRPIRHVGPIFARLTELFEDEVNGLQDADFKTNSFQRQATWNDWGYDESLVDGDDSREVLVETFEGVNAANLRRMAVDALHKIGEQGEGFGAEVDSHFERFFKLYMDFQKLVDAGIDVVWPVAVNPNTSPMPRDADFSSQPQEAIQNAFVKQGCITHGRARAWGRLFNLRYRLLLGTLAHFLRITGPRYVPTGPDKGDRTPRGFLLLWSFDEMRHLRKIAHKLVQLPLKDPADGIHAGPPFQLPYTLAIPDAEVDRWRTHLDVVQASLRLVERELCHRDDQDEFDPFLKDLQNSDAWNIEILAALAADASLPTDTQSTQFQKAAQILEEAVRGFTIEAHGNFWTGIDRDTFVDLHMFNASFIGKDENCELTPDAGFLIGQLQGRNRSKLAMPRYRPPVDPSRIEFLREWILAQAPDNEPTGQAGVEHERSPVSEHTLAIAPLSVGEPGFAENIRPLFRAFDVETCRMFDGVDLNDFDDVHQNAKFIQDRLEAGSLPYDGCWSREQIELFRLWVENGMPE